MRQVLDYLAASGGTDDALVTLMATRCVLWDYAPIERLQAAGLVTWTEGDDGERVTLTIAGWKLAEASIESQRALEAQMEEIS